MGVVYEGYDPKLGRRVAIKTIAQGPALEAETMREYGERFTREAKAAARLSHPNIVQVYDFGVENDLAYLVMEFVQGSELGAAFEADKKFDIKDATRLMTELLDALELAHNAGVVHRDIKPANVMVDTEGRAKLADFGVARVSEGHEASQAGTMVGTPAYMSPEQIQGQKVDRRTDLFSAGVILYQFLTGRKPFHGGGVYTLAKKILHEDPPRPTLIMESLSPEYDRIVSKALAKKPEDRYQTAREFSDALNRALQGKPRHEKGETPVAVPRPEPSGRDHEIEYWRSIKDSDEPADLKLYLEKFPGGVYAELAQRKMAKLQRHAEDKAKQEAEARARQDAEERAKKEAEERARREAAVRAKQEAEEKARRDAQARAKARREAEEKARRETRARSVPPPAQSVAPVLRIDPVVAKAPRPSTAALAEPQAKGSPVAPVLVTLLFIAAVAGGYMILQADSPAPVASPKPAPAPAVTPTPAPVSAAPELPAAKAAADPAAEKVAAEAAATEKRAADAEAAAARAKSDKAAAERRAQTALAAAKAAADQRAADNRAALLRFATERALGDKAAADKAVSGNNTNKALLPLRNW